MAQLSDTHPIQTRMLVNTAILQYGTLENFLKSNEYDLIFQYLEEKMRKHREAENIEKLVSYYLLVLKQPYSKATPSVKKEVVATKNFLRKALKL